MTTYIKKATSNEGDYSVRIDGVKQSGSSELPIATYVQITDKPQGFPDDIAKHILQTHEKFVVRVDSPGTVSTTSPSTSRIPCPIDGCGKNYMTKKTLAKHIRTPGVHE